MAYRYALVLALISCGPTHGDKPRDAAVDDAAATDAAPLPHTLTSIVVTPTNPLIQLDLNMPGSQDFVAMASYLDGTSDDVSAQVTWTVANANVGAISGATLAIPPFASATAETSLITATLGAIIGQAQITVVAYRLSGPTQDFFFILPYTDPAGPVAKPLDFSTTIPALDVFFLMDTTGSMAGEIANLQSALTGTIIPGVTAAVANSQFGVGALEDFPILPWGNVHGSDCGIGGESAPDQPFKLKQTITGNAAAVQTAVGTLSLNGAPIGCGNDLPEGGIEAIYQAATGQGLSSPSPTSVPANTTGIGGVGFRAGTMPVIVDITDAPTHGVGETLTCNNTSNAYTGAVAAVAHTRAQAKTALANICARVVGIAAIGAPCSPEEYLTDFATATGARVPPQAWDVPARPAGCAAGLCCTGQSPLGRAPDADGLCPVVFDVSTSGTGVGTNITTGIQMLTRFATFDVTSQDDGVTTDIDNNPLPAPHTTADFIKTVTPSGFTLPPPPPNLPNPTFDTTTFYTVTPGTQVAFSVTAFNDFVMQTDQAQIFQATIKVIAGGCTALDQRDVLILVPPAPIIVQ